MRRKTIVAGIFAALLALSFEQVNAQVAYPFYDGFESGNYSNWTIGTGSYTRSVTSATAASGSYSFTQTGGSNSHYDGVSVSFASGQTPQEISFAVRTANASTAAGYVVLRNGTTTVCFFYLTPGGRFYLNSDSAAGVAANTWYHIRIAVNWTAYTADCYVENVKVISNAPLRSNTSITNCHLYNWSPGSQAWWDDVNIGNAPVDQIKLVAVPSPTYNRKPVFHWFHHDSVSMYKLTVDVSPSFGSPLFSIPLSDTFYNPTIDLPLDTIYWKVEDYASNKYYSSVSSFSIVEPPPTMSYTPGSFKLTLNTGDSASRTLTLNNTGASGLTYNVRSSASGGAIIINELIYDILSYDEVIELWNRGGDQDMTGWRVVWNDNVGSSGSYTFPSGYIFKAGRVLSCMINTGANNDSTVYMGINIAWVSGTQLSVSLFDASTKAVDFVHTSGNADATPSGTTWKGAGVVCSTCEGLARNSNNDNDTASDWTALSGTTSYTLFALNPGQSPVSGISNGSWLSITNGTGSVSGGGSAVVGVKFDATTMIYGGTFIDSLIITHNASNQANPLIVRCTLVVISNIPALIHYTPNPTSNRKPKLMWHRVASAGSYTIQIADNAAFTSPILVQPVTDTFYQPLINLPLGPIYWKVKSDLNTTYSLPDLVIIQTDSIPTIILMVPDTITVRRPSLTWHKAAGAAIYRVQIDTAGNFSNPWLSTLVNDTFYIPTIDLPYSRICWRVSNYSYNEAAYSAVDTFWVKNPSGVIIIRPEMPVTFAMGNGWPNPFISKTAIPVVIPPNGPSVSIAIYDAKGQVVRVLQNGVLSPGYHNIVFDGKEKNDKVLSSGTYFCKMVSGDFKKTIRLLKMK